MQKNLKLFLTLLIFSLTATSVYASGTWFSASFSFATIGALVAIVIAFFALICTHGKTLFKKLALCTVIVAAGWAIGLALGIRTDAESQAKFKAMNLVYQQKEAQFRNSSLYLGACAGNLETVKLILQKDLSELDKKIIGRIAVECTLFTTPPRPEMFVALTPHMTVNKWNEGSDPVDFEYCDVLELLHRQKNTAFLDLLAKNNLPLDCTAKR